MAAIKQGADLLSRLQAELVPDSARALQTCIEICEAQGVVLFLVGGAVRDLLLGRGHIDLDLALEGDVTPVASELAGRSGGHAVQHERFGTATVKGPGFSLDLARTRSETYIRPGALPEVEPASISADLQRRDFSINAMALRLTRPAGEMIDPSGGRKDLESRLLRVLHEASFRDDATRALRAVRYAARLNFNIERETSALLSRDRSYLGSISGPRLRRELTLMFEEPTAARAALLAQENAILPAVHESLSLDDDLAIGWADALLGAHHAALDELGFCLIARPEDDGSVSSLSGRLHLAGRIEAALRSFVRLRGLFAKLTSVHDRPAAVDELLDGLHPAAIWAMSIVSAGRGGQTCAAYLSDWRKLRPRLRGADLLALGVPEGPAVGEMLRMLRRARLEGQTASKDDEVRLVQSGRRG